MENLNTPRYLNRVRNIVMENLRGLGGPPSVQMQGMFIPLYTDKLFSVKKIDIPRVPAVDDLMEDPNADEDLIPLDTRRVTRLLDSVIQPDGTLSDSEDEGEGGRRNHATNRDVDTEAPDATPAATTDLPPNESETMAEEEMDVSARQWNMQRSKNCPRARQNRLYYK
jgi:hypothetical protein